MPCAMKQGCLANSRVFQLPTLDSTDILPNPTREYLDAQAAHARRNTLEPNEGQRGTV